MPAVPFSTSAEGTPPPSQYHFLIPAWGAKYIQVFLDYTLPSHLADGNIGALPAGATLLRISTRNQDVELFRASPLFRQYEKDHPVEFESIDDLRLVKENPYQTLTACHERAMKLAVGTDTAFFFLNPDVVFADGTYRAILKLFREGKRAVLTQGLRADLPAFATDFDALRPAAGAWPSLPPRRLAKLALDNLHPLSKAHLMNGAGNRSLGSYYWPVGTDGLVCRCFHTHPLAVRPLHPVTRLYTTLDHEFVRMSCPDPATVHLVTDSDELIVIELSEPAHLADWVTAENVPDEQLQTWMVDWTNGYHREAMRRTIVYHAAPVTEEYAPAVRQADDFATRVLAEFARRNPTAGPDMTVVTRAIESEAYHAGVARAAAEATTSARAGAPAAAAQEAARAVPPPPPSFISKLRGKVHRTLNRRLYDRLDQLAAAAGTLSEQRRIDDDRLRRLETARAEQARQFEQHKADSDRVAEAAHRRTDAAERQLSDLQQQVAFLKSTHDRLLTLLSRSGVISFSHRDPARPTSQPPLGYADYDMASLVYRPAFERAIRYLQGNDLPGCVAEFGTYRGFTAQTFAELLRDTQWKADLYLYDSFEGLPAPTGPDASSYEVVRRKSWLAGEMAPEPDIVARIRKSVVEAIGAERLYIHPGFFETSLPAHPPRQPIAVLHIDADFYSSCRFVLQYLADANLLTDGGVLLMDDFNSNAANPTMGERKALADFVADNPKWTASPWFTYGWHGHAFFLHDTTVGT